MQYACLRVMGTLMSKPMIEHTPEGLSITIQYPRWMILCILLVSAASTFVSIESYKLLSHMSQTCVSSQKHDEVIAPKVTP